MVQNEYFFLQFNQRLVELYPEIYNDGSEESSEFGRKWGGYQEIYTLSQGDITRFDQITKYPLHKCLLYLAFECDRIDHQNKQINKKQ